jgi:hypothetical protein
VRNRLEEIVVGDKKTGGRFICGQLHPQVHDMWNPVGGINRDALHPVRAIGTGYGTDFRGSAVRTLKP